MSSSRKKGDPEKPESGVCPLPINPTEPEKAKEHWTPEAMKKAKPVPLPAPERSCDAAESEEESEKEKRSGSGKE